jgi:hypothetical protein
MRPIAQQRIYSINPEPFIQLENWVSSFHSYWDQQLNNLDEFLKEE